MLRTALARLIQLVPTLIIVTVVLFALLTFLPGDPALAALGEAASESARQALRAELGLDRPVIIQYLDWLWRIVQGDMGNSIRSGQPVAGMLMERLPVTLELTIGAIIVAVVTGLPLGIIAAYLRGTFVDTLSTITSLSFLAMPNFLIGLILIILFSINLRILPPSGYVPFFDNPIENLRLMILPTACVGLSVTAMVMRQTRAAMIQAISEDYVRTARSKGASEPVVLVSHALPNAVNPVITVVGLQVGTLLGGAVITEMVFSLPGLGKMLVDGILNRDLPVVQGACLVAVLFVIAVNFLVDILYTIVDPRMNAKNGGK
jgi:peptide/nickel transport system permease protein